MLTPKLARELVGVVLGHATREYPTSWITYLTSLGDLKSPRELHPIFFGSFDWHSSVHGYWLLARLLRRNHTQPRVDSISHSFHLVSVRGLSEFV